MISSSFSATFSFGSSYAASAPVTITYDPYFSSVYALLQGEGTNGSTVIVDSSTNSNAVTVTSPTALSSTRSKFGSTSVYTGVAYSSGTFTIDLGSAFLAKDYTMEMWIYYTGTDGSSQLLMSFGSTRSWQITPSGYLRYASDNYPAGTIDFSHQTQLSSNSWSHIAIVKSNNVLAMYLNGVKSTTTPTEAEVRNVLTTVSTFDMPGNINGYRLTKDFARYTTDFTPPSASFYAIGPTDPYYNNVSLLLHGTGANASTTVLDSSVAPKAVTAVGNAQINTTQYKFNNSSMYFDGSGDYMTVPTTTDFDLGSVYTIEYWIRPNSTLSNFGIVHRGFYTTTTNLWDGLAFSHRWLNTALRVYFYGTQSSNEQYIDVSGALVANEWRHIAVVRNGSTGEVFVNGTSSGSITNLNTPAISTRDLRIGRWDYSASSEDFNGYIDDLRITKGVARYTTNFTVPSVAYPSQGPTDVYYNNVSLLLHGDGTNGSTTFTDNSSTPKSVSVSGNTAISTTQFKYGAASMYFNNSVATVTSSTDFQFGTGDFTIEFWMYPTSLPSVGAIISDNGSFYIALESNGRVSMSLGGISFNAGLVSANTWTHIAFSKSSSVLKSFTNGILDNSAANTRTNDITGNLTLGQYSGIWQYPGYIDELRITKGTGRYTANFTVPAAPFPNS